MSVVDGSFNHSMELEERAAMSLAGGLMQQGYQCGMLWGAALAAGAQAYRLYGEGAQAETMAILASQRLVKSFRSRFKEINCLEITDLEWNAPSRKRSETISQVFKFFFKGGPVLCFSMAAEYARIAFSQINTIYSDTSTLLPNPPISCAALLAQKMGASGIRAVMAAGLAGGIGLSGGGCGALGAAIWIIGINDGMENTKTMTGPPGGQDAIDVFLKNSDYEFECSKIVGRQFENPGDHAAYLRDGGCSKIIDALAACKP